MSHGNPSAGARPGIVVRVRMSNVVYTSAKMLLEPALEYRDRLRAAILNLAPVGRMIEFEAAGPEFVAPVDLRADRITAVEVRSVHADHTVVPSGRRFPETVDR